MVKHNQTETVWMELLESCQNGSNTAGMRVLHKKIRFEINRMKSKVLCQDKFSMEWEGPQWYEHMHAMAPSTAMLVAYTPAGCAGGVPTKNLSVLKQASRPPHCWNQLGLKSHWQIPFLGCGAYLHLHLRNWVELLTFGMKMKLSKIGCQRAGLVQWSGVCGEERPISCQVKKKWESFLQAIWFGYFQRMKGCDLTITTAI